MRNSKVKKHVTAALPANILSFFTEHADNCVPPISTKADVEQILTAVVHGVKKGTLKIQRSLDPTGGFEIVPGTAAAGAGSDAK